MKRRLMWLPIGIAVAVASSVAIAGHGNLTDPDDTTGKLDVSEVRTWGAGTPGWKVITFETWNASLAWDRGFVIVNLDTFGDEHFDYYALVSSNGRRLEASLWRDRKTNSDRRIRTLDVWRKDRSSVSLKVPIKKLRIGKSRSTYRWFVQTLWSGNNCRSVCIDDVPGAEGVVEPLPELTPSPTPSPTETTPPIPTPTPTPTSSGR